VIGEKLGSYVVIGVLGEGGTGIVYLAEHPVIGQKAAIKVLHSRLSGDRELIGRLFNEARAAALVHHPGVVNIFDVGHHPVSGSAYIIMELLEGEPLSRRLDRERRLPEAEALRIAGQLASALRATHEKGIIHRDLKPDNIFIVPDPGAAGGERARILDFGVAKLTNPKGVRERVRTRTGLVLGSPHYMAPEQCRGGKDVDGRADVYALACVLI
jgi:eukaryotic-like serine/threonine-protein kinase